MVPREEDGVNASSKEGILRMCLRLVHVEWPIPGTQRVANLCPHISTRAIPKLEMPAAHIVAPHDHVGVRQHVQWAPGATQYHTEAVEACPGRSLLW